jgi:hypothetical protein
MPDPARPLSAALRDAPGIAALLDRYEAAQHAARLIQPLARSLNCGFDPLAPGRCELRDGILRLNAETSAQSAKLRQTGPSFLIALRSAGIQVYEMKTFVQPVVTPYPGQGTHPPSSSAEPLPTVRETTAAGIATSAKGISNVGLAAALKRLARTLGRHGRPEKPSGG